jgi:hypothetical protein
LSPVGKVLLFGLAKVTKTENRTVSLGKRENLLLGNNVLILFCFLSFIIGKFSIAL